MKRWVLVIACFLAGAGWTFGQGAGPQSGTPADPWAKLNFLVGEWTAVGAGSPGQGTGGTTFAFGLNRSVLVRTNRAEFPPKPNAVVFESDPGQNGPRYRMTYELNADKTLTTVFFFGPPGQDLKPYVEGTLKRK
jgi:hypothetical protein